VFTEQDFITSAPEGAAGGGELDLIFNFLPAIKPNVHSVEQTQKPNPRGQETGSGQRFAAVDCNLGNRARRERLGLSWSFRATGRGPHLSGRALRSHAGHDPGSAWDDFVIE
jgi:hypothetical protein